MPVLTVKVYDGGGAARVGDTFSLSGGPGDTEWNPQSVTGYAGRFIKGGNEANVHFAFDVSGIPLGSLIQRGGFAFYTSEAGTGEVAADRIGVGFVLPDGTWEVNGFARNIDVVSGPSYQFAYKFPNDGTAIPHSAANDSAAVQPGILLNDSYLTNSILTTPSNFPAETLRSFGDGSTGATFPVPFANQMNQYRNWLGHDKVAFTIASLDCSDANRRVNMYFSEVADEEKQPFLSVEWIANPAFFTTTDPPTVAPPGLPYLFDADGLPYLFGDQTNGNFLDVFFSLVTAPPGMTVDPNTGLVSWTPTSGQAGAVYDVTLRIENQGGEGSDLSWQITVPGIPFQGCPTGTARAVASVASAFRGTVAVTADARDAIAAWGDAAASEAADGDPVVRSSVEAEVRHCPKE